MIKIPILLLLVSFCFQASAWGPIGHRVTGEIAGHYLNHKARSEIRKLIGDESLAMAGNWADFIRSDPQYDHTHSWHYVNAPDGLDYKRFSALISGIEKPNAYNMLLQLGETLKDPDNPVKERAFALKFIIHLIGDMHQPMHVGREEDLGGNRIDVTWFGKPSNLHRMWDEELIGFQQLSYTEMAEAYDHATKEQIREWQNDGVLQWLFESYQMSRNLYREAERDPDLGYRYNFDHVATLQQRLLQGGIRLAGFLNELLG